jgi:hypothetical protein
MTLASEWNSDFSDALRCLAAEQAEFMMIGAHALAHHGVPRATGDMDVLVNPTQANAARVWNGLARFGAPLAALAITQADLATEGMVFQIGLPPRRIDFLTSISGVSFAAAWAGRATCKVGALEVAVIGREDLIRNKLASGRPKDLADAARLQSLIR